MFRVPAAILLAFLCHSPTDADQPLSRAEAATKLIDAALADDEGYAKLTWLCDRIGPRLAGSAGLESAVKWAADQMRRDGLVNVQTLPVAVPHWVRGRESLRVVGPFERELPLLGLGDSVGTPPRGYYR